MYNHLQRIKKIIIRKKEKKGTSVSTFQSDWPPIYISQQVVSNICNHHCFVRRPISWIGKELTSSFYFIHMMDKFLLQMTGL
jgi:hypothetical protein